MIFIDVVKGWDTYTDIQDICESINAENVHPLANDLNDVVQYVAGYTAHRICNILKVPLS